MTLQNINQWLLLGSLMISVGNALWLWLSRPARDIGKRIDATDAEVKVVKQQADERADRHREELKNHDRRIQRVEDDLRHLPTKDDLAELGHSLTGVKTELDIVARTVTRIDDFLRKHQ